MSGSLCRHRPITFRATQDGVRRTDTIALHKNARTTPAVRAEIAASDETASVLTQRFCITEQTVYKWKKRDVFGDRSHTAHHLQTVLTPEQETVVVHLRRTLLLPLDDLLAVTREFICPHVSRSGLDTPRKALPALASWS